MTVVRSLNLRPDLRVYVSAVGAIVLEQTCGDAQYVFFEPSLVPEIIAALRAIQPSAAGMQAASEALVNAEYEAWVAGGGK